MIKELLEYFSVPPNQFINIEGEEVAKPSPFPSLNGFCSARGITKKQIHDTVPKEILQRCRMFQEQYMLENTQDKCLSASARIVCEKNLIPVDDVLTRENALNSIMGDAPADGDPIELLKHIVGNRALPLGVRMDAAEKLAPYKAPKLSSVTQHIKDDNTALLNEVVNRLALMRQGKPMKVIDNAS